jgi:hypothetical protein
MKRILVASLGVAGLTVGAVSLFALPGGASTQSKTTGLKAGQTLTAASDINVPSGGTGETFGPYVTKACSSVSIYLDTSSKSDVSGSVFVGGLPGQDALIPVVGTNDSSTQLPTNVLPGDAALVTTEAVPSVDITLVSNGDGVGSVNNLYVYCGQ